MMIARIAKTAVTPSTMRLRSAMTISRSSSEISPSSATLRCYAVVTAGSGINAFIHGRKWGIRSHRIPVRVLLLKFLEGKGA